MTTTSYEAAYAIGAFSSSSLKMDDSSSSYPELNDFSGTSFDASIYSFSYSSILAMGTFSS
jgi:hypothetical protein